MQDIDFWLDDVSAANMGIMLQEPITFSAVTKRMNTVQVVGKSGDLHYDEGAYNNITGNAECFALSEGVTAQMADIMSFLFGTSGYRKLQTSDDTMHYREATVISGGETETRLATLDPFTINFNCKPFRRLLSGDDAVYIENGDTIINPTGFDAEPLIYFSAIDAGEIHIGDNTISVLSTLPDYLVMDCELQTVYPESSMKKYGYNGYIRTAQYPVLGLGETVIEWTGGVNVSKIIPRWRTL